MTKLADELWEKCHTKVGVDSWEVVDKDDFLSALCEYGEAVRAGAVKECQRAGKPVGAGDGNTYIPGTSADCAAAISRMPLP